MKSDLGTGLLSAAGRVVAVIAAIGLIVFVGTAVEVLAIEGRIGGLVCRESGRIRTGGAETK